MRATDVANYLTARHRLVLPLLFQLLVAIAVVADVLVAIVVVAALLLAILLVAVVLLAASCLPIVVVAAVLVAIVLVASVVATVVVAAVLVYPLYHLSSVVLWPGFTLAMQARGQDSIWSARDLKTYTDLKT